jgi:hypothetical protein
LPEPCVLEYVPVTFEPSSAIVSVNGRPSAGNGAGPWALPSHVPDRPSSVFGAAAPGAAAPPFGSFFFLFLSRPSIFLRASSSFRWRAVSSSFSRAR